MGNPKAFVKECKKVGVTYELLIEAQESLTKQGTAKLFHGKAKRGGGGFCSSVSIENWIETFLYVQSHPEEEDHDPYQPREVLPNENWYKFIEAVKIPIDLEIVESWKKLSKTSLGKEAKKYNYLNGIANIKALNTLHERMFEMVERRRTFIWNKPVETAVQPEEENYNLMNIHQLKEIAKEYGISTNLKKEELIIEIQSYQEKDIIAIDYCDMSTSRLKVLAKEQGLLEYNNLKKEDLIQLLKQKDIEAQKEEEKNDSIILGGIEVISRSEDGYINATQLCKAGDKEYSGWNRNTKTEEFLTELESVLQICRTELLKVNSGGINQHTWVHPRVAIHIAQWVSPKFAVIVTGWIHTLLSSGKMEIDKPIKSFSNLSERDTEAIQLEKGLKMEEYTTTSVIYMAYIGKNMLKIGYTDSSLLNRTKKHTSSESMYPQWCFVGFIKVSGKPIEALLHKFLLPYQTEFNKQKEIYKVNSTITSFLEVVTNFVEENDLPMKIKKLEKQVSELQIENLQLKLQLK
jgi:hypothetical protein